MKIAIPIFGIRVSPRFISSDLFLVVDTQDGEILNKETIPFNDPHPLKCSRFLMDMGVEMIICGGINRFSEQQLNFNGIKVFPWITGEVNDVLQSFLKGDLDSIMRSPRNHNMRSGCKRRNSMNRNMNKNNIIKEVLVMPNKDGTGPAGGGGRGTGNGRGQGSSGGGKGQGRGKGRGQGGGRGQGRGIDQTPVKKDAGKSVNDQD
ncbi:NifB/NifX family molybdenum-iron cluster-binding protein [candidate division KSB1 bacterium]